MESQHLLSNDEFAYIASQNIKPLTSPAKSTYRKRVQKKVRQAFKTFEIVLESKALTQKRKDELFSHEEVRRFLRLLTRFETGNALVDENNKQTISHTLIQVGLAYYQSRYAETSFFKREIEQAQSLLRDLDLIAQKHAEDAEAHRFYAMRGSMRLPPRIERVAGEWRSVCMVCWRASSGKTEADAMQNIRHQAGCTYDKRDLEWCIRTYPPLQKEKQEK